MAKPREFEGYKFLLDDSKGCYIEVKLGKQTGYVGVNLAQGTSERPYCWFNSNAFTVPDGLNGGKVSGPTIEDNLQALFKRLISAQEQEDAHNKFDQEAACKALHEYVEKLEG